MNKKMYVKDKYYDPLLEDVVTLLNEWAEANHHYNARVEFYINSHKVRDTKIERGFKHFYTDVDENKTES